MTTKITYLDAINYAIANGNFPAEYQDVFEKMRVSYEKRKATPRKETKKQAANKEFAERVLAGMEAEPNKAFSAKELAETYEVAVQKMTPILTNLVKGGKVYRAVVKGKPAFSVTPFPETTNEDEGE